MNGIVVVLGQRLVEPIAQLGRFHHAVYPTGELQHIITAIAAGIYIFIIDTLGFLQIVAPRLPVTVASQRAIAEVRIVFLQHTSVHRIINFRALCLRLDAQVTVPTIRKFKRRRLYSVRHLFFNGIYLEADIVEEELR